MHRQSLGSPASKLQSHGIVFSDTGVRNDNNDNNFVSEDNRKDKCSASATDNEEHKSQKHNQQKSVHDSSSSSSSSKLVHLIPILMLFCFLILYLSSHDPSNTDLGQSRLIGFETIPSKKTGVDDNVGGGSMEIRSVRKLEQPERRRFHRKLRR